jgi:hypothetical protein
MRIKFWPYNRKEIFFSFDSIMGKKVSLFTSDQEEAKQIKS